MTIDENDCINVVKSFRVIVVPVPFLTAFDIHR